MMQRETERLREVARFQQYDFDLNTGLQGVLKVAADIYQAPAAFVTLIDEHHQLFKVNHGFDVLQMPRATSFCTHTIMNDTALVIPDAAADDRFAANPFITNAPNIRFYAGAPMASYQKQNVGTLCVMDVTPKAVSENQMLLLEILARQAVHLMELQLTYTMLDEKMRQVHKQNESLKEIAFIQSHEFRGPLATVMGIMNMIKEDDFQSPREHFEMLEEAVNKLDDRIHVVVKSTEIAKGAYFA